MMYPLRVYSIIMSMYEGDLSLYCNINPNKTSDAINGELYKINDNDNDKE